MTKPTPDDALKCHLTMEEPKDIIKENALTVCNAQTNPELKNKLEVTKITTEIEPRTKRLQKVELELFNLEDYTETEKKVKINLDLNLYQMERI